MLKPIFCMLLALSLTPAYSISEFELISTENASQLHLKLTLSSASETILITPEDAKFHSNNQFSLLQNLTFESNFSEIVQVFEIDRSSNETLYSGGQSVWCGASFSDCGNCNGMPPGTFKWCNGAYPLRTYSCDNWCYTYSPQPTYEKAQIGAFLRMAANGSLIARGAPEYSLAFSDPDNEQIHGSIRARLIFPLILPPSQNQPLMRSQGSQKWQLIQNSVLQSYKSTLYSYYSQYMASIESAYGATSNLNSALNSLVSTASGEYYDFYTVQNNSSYPEIEIFLDSDYAGVTALRGRPQALALNPEAQFEGGAPYYTLEVLNSGSISDSFLANLSCNGSPYSSAEAVVGQGQQALLKLFVAKMDSPQLCAATVFVKDLPQIASSISNTLQPFKLPCPPEYSCCPVSTSYEERPCLPLEKFKQEDEYGNGYFYLQHYSCEAFSCLENTTTFLRRISDRRPPQQSAQSSFANYNSPQIRQQQSPTPTLVPSIAPSSGISPIAQPLVEIPIEEEKIEIIAQSEVQEGYASVSVRANSEPAQGAVLVVSPSMKRHTLPLNFGSTEVLFNEPGPWSVSYSFEYKTIQVHPIAEKQMEAPVNVLPNPATPLMALSFPNLPFIQTALLISLLVFVFAVYKRQSETIRFRKSFENNIVRLEILNGRGDLRNLEITDIAPEGTILSTISNPPSEVTEIIFGKHIKWKKSALPKGERMLISYSIFTPTPQGSLQPAEILADTEGNKRIRVLSNAVEL